MIYVKKLTFALPFLLILVPLFQYLSFFLGSSNLLFDFSLQTLIKTLTFTGLIAFASLFFVLFVTLSNDWKLVLPISFLGSLIPLVTISAPLSFTATTGTLLVLSIIFFIMHKQLASYLTFQSTKILIPHINQTIGLLLIVISLTFYQANQNRIQTEGFKIPDSLIETSLKLSGAGQSSSEEVTPTLPQISAEQLQLLKQNPQLLAQYGLDPSILDQIETPSQGKPSSTQDFLKSAVQNQMDSLTAPYIWLIPIILAVVFFFSLKWLASLVALLFHPLIWFIFWILEQSGFIHFETEMREVKKLVV